MMQVQPFFMGFQNLYGFFPSTFPKHFVPNPTIFKRKKKEIFFFEMSAIQTSPSRTREARGPILYIDDHHKEKNL